MINLREREENVLKYWEADEVERKFREKNKDGKRFYLLDGPPYVTSTLASHHVWVVTIKDIVLRYKRYRGFNLHDRAGFDVHGLPIENKVERKLNLKSKMDIEKVIGVERFVHECRRYAEEQMETATKIFKRYGYSADFTTTYVPFKNEYISKGWGIFKGMDEKGLLYKDLQPLAYCPHCETALSQQGPEIEYSDETDQSIFVKFKIGKSAKLNLPKDKKNYLVIWTTTPWTLPANMVIAANPTATYVLADVEGENYIVAKDLLDKFTKALDKSSTVLSEFFGTELEGTTYSNPLEEKIPKQKEFAKYHKVIMSESLVSTTEGTGLVHTASGFGPEDYKVCKANRVPVFSPVDAHANYTDEVGSYKGLKVPEEANRAVMHDLKENGHLLYMTSITHTYPHCWRCASKLIFRADTQWFINVQKLKKKMIKENSKIKWHPEYAQKWQESAIESSPDWCISRQRYWGAPIPIWICDQCKEYETIGSVDELVKRAGLGEQPKDLHKPYIDQITFKCKCGGTMHRVKDIFDVWYDSGVAHTASLSDEEFKELFPVDWITESLDQIRGWFTMLLRTSVAVYGKRSFNEVNIGGMIVDELGNEMHRHLGNAALATEILQVSSADGYRLWCSSHPRWQQLRLKKHELTEADGDIIMLYNVAELVKEFSALSGFDLKETKKPGLSKLELEDRWMLSKMNSLIWSVTNEMDNYAIDVAVNMVKNFIVEDLSRFYLKFAKQRAATASKSQLKRIANLTGYLLRNTLVLASIITPFACESIYQEMFAKEKQSIFMNGWPKAQKKAIDTQIEDDFSVLKDISTAVLALREKNGIKLRWPVLSVTVETNDDRVIASIERVSGIIESYTNVKSVKFRKGQSNKKEIRPVFAKLGPAFKGDAQAIALELPKQDAEKVEKEVLAKGSFQLHTNKGTFNVLAEHFTVLEKPVSGEAFQFKHGLLTMDTTQTDELKAELMVREVVRRIQMMRKDQKMTKINMIEVGVVADKESNELLKKNEKSIKEVVKAAKLHVMDELKPEHGFYEKTWEISGITVRIGIKKAD